MRRIERVEVLYHFLGNEERMSYFPEEVKPFFVLPEGHDGIDLRAYDVFCADFGLGGRPLAQRIQRKNPQGILLYTGTAFSGDWVEGIVLPKGFDSGRVVFYKTLKQRESEIREEDARRSKELCNQVLRQFPNVFVHQAETGGGVVISPKLGVLSKRWRVPARSVEEVGAIIRENASTWKEWEGRFQEVYRKHGWTLNCFTEAEFVDTCSPHLVAVSFDHKKEGWRDPRKGWVVLKKEKDEWKELGCVVAHDAVYNINNLLRNETKLLHFLIQTTGIGVVS